MAPSSPARIRRAAPSDRGAVLAFCQDTFSWGDYIAEVWDDWLDGPDGILLVAEVADGPVAVGHARLMSAHEAWLEGLRVHPDHRRRGIADAMNAAGCNWARARGATVARLATETTNEPALRQVARLGFTPLADFGYWLAGADAEISTPGVREGRADELDKIEATRRASDVTVAGGGLVAVGWGWRELTVDDLAAALTDGRAEVLGDGFSVLGLEADEVRLLCLDGVLEARDTLLMSTRRRAADGGQAQVSALLPRHAGIEAALARAGFEQEGTYRILTKAL